MLGLLMVVSALLGDGPGGPVSTPASAHADQDSYNAALEQIGNDAAANVRMALWCEAHGMDAERVKHLTLAVLKDPGHALARALLGMVSFQGRWKRPEAVGAAVAADPARQALMAEYEAKRGKLRVSETADAHWKLALWCEEKGLKAESVAHLWSTLRLDRTREAAWKRLGYKKQKDGRRLTDAQVELEKQELELQTHADRQWKPVLEKWRGMLGEKVDEARRATAEAGLAQVVDPRAVPMVWSVFATGDESRQKMAVQVLGQIDAPGASRALALLAAFSKSADVRRAATETVLRRDVREFGHVLIDLLRNPIKYEVRAVNGPGSPGELFIHGTKANLKRLYSPPPMPSVPVMPGAQIGYDANGLPVLQNEQMIGATPFLNGIQLASLVSPPHLSQTQQQQLHHVIATSGLGTQGPAVESYFAAHPGMANAFTPWSNGNIASLEMSFGQIASISGRARPLNPSTQFSFSLAQQTNIPIGQMAVEAQKTAAFAQQQLQNDVAVLERYNAPIQEANGRVIPILQQVSGQDFGDDREAWTKWWIDQVGYSILPQKFSDTPTIVENVPLDYQPQPVPVNEFVGVVGFRWMSCFAAGTPVHTMTGIRAIETLRVGDEVLSQNLKTGALGYQPVLVVHRNPPARTFRIAIAGENVLSSEFHRFWKPGKGWVMARDLKPGDALRTLGGVVKVASVEPGEVQPVFNLDVADDADFFVGQRGALVHDNTLPDLRLAPFDAAPSLASSAHP